MTIDHRKSAITAEIMQANVGQLIEALARALDEKEKLSAELAALKPKGGDGAKDKPEA